MQRMAGKEPHLTCRGAFMAEDRLQISGIDQLDKDRVLVDFSDDTQMTFTTAELMALAPKHDSSNVKGRGPGDEDLG
jgi:hypothetical protein